MRLDGVQGAPEQNPDPLLDGRRELLVVEDLGDGRGLDVLPGAEVDPLEVGVDVVDGADVGAGRVSVGPELVVEDVVGAIAEAVPAGLGAHERELLDAVMVCEVVDGPGDGAAVRSQKAPEFPVEVLVAVVVDPALDGLAGLEVSRGLPMDHLLVAHEVQALVGVVDAKVEEEAEEGSLSVPGFAFIVVGQAFAGDEVLLQAMVLPHLYPEFPYGTELGHELVEFGHVFVGGAALVQGFNHLQQHHVHFDVEPGIVVLRHGDLWVFVDKAPKAFAVVEQVHHTIQILHGLICCPSPYLDFCGLSGCARECSVHFPGFLVLLETRPEADVACCEPWVVHCVLVSVVAFKCSSR